MKHRSGSSTHNIFFGMEMEKMNGIPPILRSVLLLLSMKSSYLTNMVGKTLPLRDMFHVYLNRFEFLVLWLHIIKTNSFCFFMHNRRVPGIAKQTRWQFIE